MCFEMIYNDIFISEHMRTKKITQNVKNLVETFCWL